MYKFKISPSACALTVLQPIEYSRQHSGSGDLLWSNFTTKVLIENYSSNRSEAMQRCIRVYSVNCEPNRHLSGYELTYGRLILVGKAPGCILTAHTLCQVHTDHHAPASLQQFYHSFSETPFATVLTGSTHVAGELRRTCFEDGLAIGAFTFHSDSSDLTSSIQQLSHRPGQGIEVIRNMHSRDMYSRDTLVPTKHGLTNIKMSSLRDR